MSTIGWIDYSTQLDSPGLRLVHLCPIYFDTDHVTAGSVGFYRQGTLFGHEMSHEPSVAATLDFKCEIPMCKAMAMQQPTGAVRSADNYTHCAEEGQFTAEARMMGMAQDAGCHCNLGRRALPLYAPFCIALIVVSLFRRRLTMRKSLFLIVLSLIVPACIHSGVETRAVAAST